jgi:lambda family phage portal protein
VRTPGGTWDIDGRASNCTRPDDDTHRCWVRHGDPRTGVVHVDKDGDTCGAGSGSIRHRERTTATSSIGVARRCLTSTKRPGLFARMRAAIARVVGPVRRRFGFAAAQFSRITSEWVTAASRSADDELRGDLKILRNRARDLVRNSPFGIRYHQLLAENVIGPDGIRLQAKNLTLDGQAAQGANAGIEAAWADWSCPQNCDVTGMLSLTELLALATSNWGSDGEYLIRFLRGPRFGPYGLKLQLLDVDYLDEMLYRERLGNQNAIHHGVEIDEYGARVGYWIWTAHPNTPAANRTHVFVPAADMIHFFIPLRPGQSRGIPHATAILTTIKMLDGYLEAELVAARTASATMGALEDISTDGTTPAPNPNAGEAEVPLEVEPGALMDLRGRAAKLSLWDPQHPTQAFPDFTKAMCRFIAVGLGIAYGTLTGDVSDANYSSMKVGRQPEIEHWRRLQRAVITHVLTRIYGEFLKAALLNQLIAGVTDYDTSAGSASRGGRAASRRRIRSRTSPRT